MYGWGSKVINVWHQALQITLLFLSCDFHSFISQYQRITREGGKFGTKTQKFEFVGQEKIVKSFTMFLIVQK